MDLPVIYADFHNADPAGRLRLNCEGTYEDLARTGITLSEGMTLTLSDDELAVEGEVRFSAEEQLWVAVIDWKAIRDVPPSAAASRTPAA